MVGPEDLPVSSIHAQHMGLGSGNNIFFTDVIDSDRRHVGTMCMKGFRFPYQVASHLMFKGEVEKGLDIVRLCRKRYDGRVRNPFNEYECGNWYARAMSSYAMLEGLTGVRYDAVDQILYIDSKVGDFTSFLSAETGFGTVGLKDGNPFLKVVYGKINPQKVIVSGVEKHMVN